MPQRILDTNALSWLPEDQIEPQALVQIKNLAEMPFIFKHVAVMPDCHLGKGATVGTCIPTQRAIVPAAVGVDIGCGMVAVKTPFTRHDVGSNLTQLRLDIESQIPLSAGHYNEQIGNNAQSRIQQLEAKAAETERLDFYNKVDRNWRLQMGSLGSGNHFIEVVTDEDNNVWAFLHSGSRGVGNKLASHHIDVAKKMMKRWFIDLPDPDLAYLAQDTQEFRDYLTDLSWAQEFALLNRAEMMQRVLNVLAQHYGEFEELERVECHHNFTQWEHHMGQNILVSRKGAIQAREGQMGLIPGSMGTRSYVVRGLGNRASFDTAPHGAGRRLSRSAAVRAFTMNDFDHAMEGIEVNRSEAFLDELPAAYKDIDLVLEQSKDLVEVVHTFRQIVNVKGD